MSKLVVYWSNVDRDIYTSAMGRITKPPEKLSLSLKNLPPLDKKQALYLKCPSIVEETKKYYAVKSPFNYTLKWSRGEIRSNNRSQEFFENFVSVQAPYLLFLDYYYIFFCEEDLEITILPPFLHGDKINRDTLMLPASMNIGKWVRPIHPYYIYKQETGTITLEENEPLFYIRFNTAKEIVFKRFEYTDNVKKIVNDGSVVSRKFYPTRRLSYYYNLFNQYRFRGALIKEIKQNLNN